MAPQPPKRDDGLALRAISGAVMAPCVIAAVFAGPTALFLLIVLAAAAMAWEWARLVGDADVRTPAVVLALSVTAAIEMGFLEKYAWSIVVTALGVAAVFVATRIAARRRAGIESAIGDGVRTAAWVALGAAYIGLPCVGFLWLTRGEPDGRDTALWLIGVVWATDIGAYMFGRLIGGPKLAPKISPGKTWAGLLGGVVCATAAGFAAVLGLGVGSAAAVIVISGALAVMAQIGDLAESAVKRQFGRKDSSSLIPGHGGFLDRLDGFLAVSAGAALLTLAIGENVLSWR